MTEAYVGRILDCCFEKFNIFEFDMGCQFGSCSWMRVERRRAWRCRECTMKRKQAVARVDGVVRSAKGWEVPVTYAPLAPAADPGHRPTWLWARFLYLAIFGMPSQPPIVPDTGSDIQDPQFAYEASRTCSTRVRQGLSCPLVRDIALHFADRESLRSADCLTHRARKKDKDTI